MKTILFILFGVASVVLGVSFFACALRRLRNKHRDEYVFSAMQLGTLGTFLAVFLVFVPIYYTSYDFEDSFTVLRPLLLAFHNTIRIFILDGDFDIIVKALSDQYIALRVSFSLYAAFLYVVAPVLTFGNVLFLFRHIWDGVRFKFHKKRAHYIMSALNEKSVVLAKSIYEEHKDAVIVFANIADQDESDGDKLLDQARELNAICLKKDITDLNVTPIKGVTEFFLISNDESENVSKAIKLTAQLNEMKAGQNKKVFVFSSKPGADCVIDSIKYDNLLEATDWQNYDEGGFKLRRINEKQQLIWNTVPNMKLFEIADRNDKTLSVMLVGLGNYGMELFKMLLWYCQFQGYKLQINIMDKQGKSVESLINRVCPEILKTNRSEIYGEACYDIEVFSDVDATTADIDALLLYDGHHAEKAATAQRLKATDLVFVALGDDDTNIEVSLHLRSLFDQAKGIKADKKLRFEDEQVEIYSVVFDDLKTRTLYTGTALKEADDCLVNHKEIPYHIHFIGAMSAQFAYRNIYNAQLEKLGCKAHMRWVELERKTNPDDPEILESVKKERMKYEQYEYYRNSSVASMLYKKGIKSNAVRKAAATCCAKEKKENCDCVNCIRRKCSEHMRWNAYTRVTGYSYSPVRSDRAKLHNNLCGWEKLSLHDRLKDDYDMESLEG